MRIFQIAWGGISRQNLYELISLQRELLDVRMERIEDLEEQLADSLAFIDGSELQQIKTARDLIQNFHDSLEAEVDEDVLRDGLEIALVDLNDHVARLEEHSGI